VNSAIADDRYSIRAVERTLDIIQCVADSPEPLTVDQIVAATGLAKTTVFRVLATLTARRFVNRDLESQTYRLGAMALRIGTRALGDLDVARVAQPHLERLMRETGETVHLSVVNGRTALCIAKIDSLQAMRMASYVGFRGPLHCSGTGKALLAFLDAESREDLLQRLVLVPRTARTITDKAVLRDELDHIRERGFALDIGEIEDELACIAAPLRDHSGQTIAAVSISGPMGRINDGTMPGLIGIVRGVAAAISSELGFIEQER